MSANDDWLNDFAAKFRRECESLRVGPEVVPAKGPTTLFPPCQFYVVGSTDPVFQYLLITHNPALPDLERVIEVDVPAYEFIDVLERLKSRPEFRSLKTGHTFMPGSEDAGTLTEFLDRSFSSFLARRWPAVIGARPGVMSRGNVNSVVSLYEIRGRVIDQSSATIADEIVAELKAAIAPQSGPTGRVFSADSGIPACGAYIYPSVQVGERPPLSFRQRASGLFWDPRSPKVVIRETFRNVPVSVDLDGLVMLRTDDPPKGLIDINRLMAALSFLGLPTLAVREAELIHGTLNAETLELTSSATSLSSLRNIDRFDFARRPLNVMVNKVSTADFQTAVRTADAIMREQSISQDLVLSLEAFSHLADQEYTPAFLIAWTVIERRLSAKWRLYLQRSGVARKRLPKLTNPERWSVDYLIECLQLIHEAAIAEEYEHLMDLKTKRNSIAHGGRSATKSEADAALAVAHRWVTAAIADSVGTVQPLKFERTIRITQ